MEAHVDSALPRAPVTSLHSDAPHQRFPSGFDLFPDRALCRSFFRCSFELSASNAKKGEPPLQFCTPFLRSWRVVFFSSTRFLQALKSLSLPSFVDL